MIVTAIIQRLLKLPSFSRLHHPITYLLEQCTLHNQGFPVNFKGDVKTPSYFLQTCSQWGGSFHWPQMSAKKYGLRTCPRRNRVFTLACFPILILPFEPGLCRIDAEQLNLKGRSPFHVLAWFTEHNTTEIFSVFLDYMPEYPIDKTDSEGN